MQKATYNIKACEFVLTDSKFDLRQFFIHEQSEIPDPDPRKYLDAVSDSLIKKIAKLRDNKKSITPPQEKELQFMLDAFITTKTNLKKSLEEN